MAEELPSVGQIVSSKAGRDADRYYLVVGIVDSRTVLVADGDVRRFENPKRKNIRHLVLHREIVAAVAQKIAAGATVSNAEIRRSLAERPAPAQGEVTSGKEEVAHGQAGRN